MAPKKGGASSIHSSKKEKIPLFLGPKRASLVVCDPVKPCTPQPSLVRQHGSWVRFEDPVIRLLTHPWPSCGDSMEIVSVQRISQTEVCQLRAIKEVSKGPTETFSEAPGAYGMWHKPHGFLHMKTASALASWPSPEVAVAERHAPCDKHPGLSLYPQPVNRPFASPGQWLLE
ncbi:hypothetical protein PO909_025453 [Leuciscus waleckii]